MFTRLFASGKQQFWDEVELWRGEAELPRFFWRDDDAAKWSPNLELCLKVADQRNIAVAFAAIPALLTRQAADAIRSSRLGRIAVHGYKHENHAAAGAQESEFPLGRAPDAVLHELRGGFELIKFKAGDRYLNMFVPPWGRFDHSFDGLLSRAGVVCFSGAAHSKRYTVALQHNCQISAEQSRLALDLEAILGRVARQLQLRREGKLPRKTPLGLMTHHATFDAPMLTVLEQLLDVIGEAGFEFSNFSEIDAVAERGTSAGRGAIVPKTPPHERQTAALELLLSRTLPRESEGYPGLDKLLALLANVSPIALIRFAHLRELAARLPANARVLSAGCGKAIAEVALAMMHPEQRWVAVDADATRFAQMETFASQMQVTNISFEKRDLDALTPDDPAGFELGGFDAVVLVEVLMYLSDPATTVAGLARLLRSGGQLCAIEAFAPDEQDTAALGSLRAHTQSKHGGFSHAKLQSYVDGAAGLELVRVYNCYRAEPQAVVTTLWKQLAETSDPAFMDLVFATAQLDLGGQLTSSRSEATGVAFLARAQ